MTADFLSYEVALLLAKYGKSAVLKALEQKLNLTKTELEDVLKNGPIVKAQTTRPRSAVDNPLESLVRDYPDKEKYLRSLHERFHNRTFLPELRDVKRFFDRHSHPFGSVKSRADSLPRLLHLLASLDNEELNSLYDVDVSNGYSSLGIIADAILRKHG